MPFIAILIPTYKPSCYIKRCLKSIDRQSLSKDKFKVYIALNGPRGEFEETVRWALEDVSFNYDLYYLSSAGVSNARNYLIEKSVEPFIAFIDDDDVISSVYLESLLSVSGHDIVGVSNVYNFERNISERKPNYIGQSFLKLPCLESSKFKGRKYFSSPCAKLLHRDIISSTRFNIKLSVGEDALFMAELSNRVKAIRKTSSEAIYYVCEREGSASRSKVDKRQEIKRVFYLMNRYFLMLFNSYDLLFILTRLAATVKQLTRLIKF